MLLAASEQARTLSFKPEKIKPREIEDLFNKNGSSRWGIEFSKIDEIIEEM